MKVLLSAIDISNIDDEFKDGLRKLLNLPEVASKWKNLTLPVKYVNDGDPNFAKDMSAAQKEQNLTYPEQGKEYASP